MKALIIISLFTLASCATSYQPMGLSGGYREELVAHNTYEVTFSGNGYTGRQRVNRFLKRRCAELTKEHGFSHYILVNGSEGKGEKPHNQVTIKLVNNPSPEVVAYEADRVIRNTAD